MRPIQNKTKQNKGNANNPLNVSDSKFLSIVILTPQKPHGNLGAYLKLNLEMQSRALIHT